MQLIWSIFPKFLAHLSPNELGETVREVGLDTTNLVVRDGFPLDNGNLKSQIAPFLKELEAAGVRPHFATTGWAPTELERDATPLQILADHGIREFRMSYFHPGGAPNAAFDDARHQIAKMAALCEKNGIRAVYQVHHGLLVTDSFAARALVESLSPQHVGIELDPGNQAHEGFENWQTAVNRLGDYLSAWGIKDVKWMGLRGHRRQEPDKGWGKMWTSCDGGIINWLDVARAVWSTNRDQTLVLMPFYHADDPKKHIETLKREVAYLRAVWEEAKPQNV